VAPTCALLDQFGVPSERLFAVGPLTRAAFGEIVAVPDIRDQCGALATYLSRNLSTALRAARDRPQVGCAKLD
jgi:uncharacterized NAD(P)/FAD-binding protein YdhS